MTDDALPASAGVHAGRRPVHRDRVRGHRARTGTVTSSTIKQTPRGHVRRADRRVVVVGVMFMTAEYRRGLIRTTLTASPRRGRVLAAKAIVIGAVTFVAGLVAAADRDPGRPSSLLHENGNPIPPVTALTGLQVVVGTAALLAVSAVLALAVGTMLRRSAAAVTAVIVVIVLPYLLARVPGILPVGAAQWLLRAHPGGRVRRPADTHRSTRRSQTAYTPGTGYFPLAPWAGFAVLCACAAVALALALFLLRRRDA